MFSVLSWNVNGLLQVLRRYRLKSISDLLSKCESWAAMDSADTTLMCCCFQEVKLRRKELNRDLLTPAEYDAYYSLARQTQGVPFNRFSGVAVYTRRRVQKADSTSSYLEPASEVKEGVSWALQLASSIEGYPFTNNLLERLQKAAKVFDQEGRCLTISFKSISIVNIYGIAYRNEDRYELKQLTHQCLEILMWVIQNHFKHHLMVLGDLNVTATILDTCDPDGWVQRKEDRIKAGYVPDSDWFKHICDQFGLVDCFRQQHPERRKAYTCWNQLSGARESNYGTRLDYILTNLDPGVVHAADILPQVLGSDHCPVVVHIDHSVFQVSKDVDFTEIPFLALKGSNLPEAKIVQSQLSSWLANSRSPTEESQSVDLSDTEEDTSADVKDEKITREDPGSTPTASPVQPRPETEKVQMSSGKKRPTQATLTSFFVKRPKTEPPRHQPVSQDIEMLEITDGETPERPQEPQEGERQQVEVGKTPERPQGPGRRQADADGSSTTKLNNTQHKLLVDLDEELIEEDEKETGNESWQKIFRKGSSLTEDQIRRMQEAVSYLSRKEQDMYFDMATRAPLCPGHKLPAIQRVTKKAGPNFGRRFWTCCCPSGDPSSETSRCNYFAWHTTRRLQQTKNKGKRLLENIIEHVASHNRAIDSSRAADISRPRKQHRRHHHQQQSTVSRREHHHHDKRKLLSFTTSPSSSSPSEAPPPALSSEEEYAARRHKKRRRRQQNEYYCSSSPRSCAAHNMRLDVAAAEHDRYEKQRIENQRLKLQAKMDRLRSHASAGGNTSMWGNDRYFDADRKAELMAFATKASTDVVVVKTDECMTPTSGISGDE